MKTTKRKVAKRQTAPAASTPPPAPPVPISTTLSPQASALVRWYCGITRHREEDAVEGAVFGLIERAKDAYDEGNRHNESFNWLMEDVLRGMNDDLRKPARLMYGGGYTVHLSVEASALLSRYTDSTGDDPRDVVSGALESMLRCVLEDGEVGFPEARAQAMRQRLADEAERQRRNEAMEAFYARKEVAA